MFFGEYRHQIDEKGRVRIPSKLKDLLGDNPFITKGSNNCLFVIPKEQATKMFTDKFGGIDFTDPVNNKALRLLTASGTYAEEDKQGRILLPSSLLKHSKISKNIVTIGAFNRVEIWSEENWDEYSNVDSEEFDKCLVNDVKPKE